MMHDLRPYPEYRDSGLTWLGRVPAHWAIVASKRLFTERKQRALPEDEQLSATQSHGVILQKDYERLVGRKVVRILQHLEKRRHVEKDDFVISMRSFQGGLERAWCRGAIRSSYVVLKPGSDAHVGYFAHMFKSHHYIHALRATSDFIRDGQDLTFSNFSLIDLPIVPMDEQKAIGDYLDAHGRLVDRFIRNKRRLIELLNEQKRGTINRVVTRGLGPSLPLAPSGIAWLGEVPVGWTLQRFKFAVRVNSGQVDPRQVPYADYLLIAPNHVESATGRILKEETAREQGASSGKYVVRRGQVIYSKIRPKLRKAAIAPQDCLCSADMYALSPKSSELRADYLLLLLLSDPVTRYTVDCSMRVAMPKVNRDALGDCWLWYPSLSEQDEILNRLSLELEPLHLTHASIDKEIDLIIEYRARLIADVVTGKVDVRHLAPETAEALPDDAELQPDHNDLLEDAPQDADGLDQLEDLPDADSDD